jgi:hypothetical protein
MIMTTMVQYQMKSLVMFSFEVGITPVVVGYHPPEAELFECTNLGIGPQYISPEE